MKRKDIDCLIMNSLLQMLINQNDSSGLITDLNVAINKLAEPAPKKENKTFYQRKLSFELDFKKVLDKHSINNYSVIGFFEYWTESSKDSKKMRFEKEKVFDMKRRVNTWVKNNGKFNQKRTESDSREEFEYVNSVFNG